MSTNDVPKSILSICMTIVIEFILDRFLDIPGKPEEDFNEYLKSGNTEKIIMGL